MRSVPWPVGAAPALVTATLVVAACAGAPAPAPAPEPAAAPPTSVLPARPGRSYRLLAGAESDDEVALIEFTPCPAGDSALGASAARASSCGAKVVRTYQVGIFPSDIEGPHGLIASHDGKSFYVSIAHGRPNGYLQKFDLVTGRLLGQVELGMFPATVDLSPFGELVYVINFNFEDPAMQPSSLSIVDGETMTEIARPATCRMPHGSRLDPTGTRHYSGCMMNDLLVEVNARTFQLSRLFALAPGREGPVAAANAAAHGAGGHAGHAEMAAGPDSLAVSSACSPTWAQPSADGSKVYVACNKSAEIVEVDVAGWRMTRRWRTPAAPYNLAVTPDGRLLVATQKGPGTTTIWRLADARLLADVPGTRKVASGVAVSGDSRYAFVTYEGIGGDPGTIDVIDLAALRRVATVDIGKQAGGIALLSP
jgi:DNA-binding beta-propeller fold protein YncE